MRLECLFSQFNKDKLKVKVWLTFLKNKFWLISLKDWKMRWTTTTSAEKENILTTRTVRFRQTSQSTSRDTSAKQLLSCIRDSRSGFQSDLRGRAGTGAPPPRFRGCHSLDRPWDSLLCQVSLIILFWEIGISQLTSFHWIINQGAGFYTQTVTQYPPSYLHD